MSRLAQARIVRVLTIVLWGSLAISIFVALGWVEPSAPAAYAAVIAVNTQDDELNSDGDCSLREAIQAANINASVDACTPGSIGLDTIQLDWHPQTLTIAGADASDGADNTTGDLDIIEDVQIIGDCSGSKTHVQGGSGFDDRIFHIYNTSGVTLSCIWIADGNTAGPGGGVKVEGSSVTFSDVFIFYNNAVWDGGGMFIDEASDVTLNNVMISGNSCTEPGNCYGGGIANYGVVSINDGRIVSNDAEAYGGGLYNHNFNESVIATATLNNVLIESNDASEGAGIYNGELLLIEDSLLNSNYALKQLDSAGGGIYTLGNTQLRNVTLSGNIGNSTGGGIHQVGGGLTLINVTITENNAPLSGLGAGLYTTSGNLYITNSILADNGSYGQDYTDCYNDGSTLWTHEYNLQGVRSSDPYACDFNGVGEMQGSPWPGTLDARLGYLRDNGGSHMTRALMWDSPAIDAGNPLPPGPGACQLSDQRGALRPHGEACDMGAYERVVDTPVDFNADETSDVVVFRGGAWRFFDFPSGAFDHGVWTGTSPGCIAAPLDYDGDGVDTPSQLCAGAWHFYADDGTYKKGIWTGGVAGDLPVPADYNGDGVDEVVVWRAGAWRFFDFDTGEFDHGVWTGSPPNWLGGINIPVPMDYDGDGAANFTVFSGGPWHFYSDFGDYRKGIWTGGVAGDLPVPGDYDGNLLEEIVVWRAGAWRFFDFETAAFDHGVWTGAPPHWTGGTSLPSPLDYDGDGSVDFTVFSGGPWHFYNPDGSYNKGIWTGGVAGDLPISRRLLP